MIKYISHPDEKASILEKSSIVILYLIYPSSEAFAQSQILIPWNSKCYKLRGKFFFIIPKSSPTNPELYDL